jgi:pilus retraction protein PilT
MDERTPEARFLLQRLLLNMERWGASDLLVAVGRKPAVRVDGRIGTVEGPVVTGAHIDELLGAALTTAQRARLDATGDLDCGYSIDGRRFRLNFARQQGGLSFVARAVPRGDVELDALGLPDAVGALAELPRGLVLVTGATGSGKSTTLAALVHRVNTTRAAHIVTIEDPIEFVHVEQRARITQREVGADTTDFHAALRGVVRQSPDVIVVGEMRDLDTMRAALSAALTGHLVVATLHTIDATQTLQRILSYFPEEQRAQAALDLSMSLQGVVSQRLLPRADRRGRVVAVELLTIGPAARRLIREQRVDELYDLMRGTSDPGMVTFHESLLGLLRAGAITWEVGRAYATNPDEYALAAQGMSTGSATFREADDAGDLSGLDMKRLLAIVQERGASDLHLTVGRPPILRIHGELVPLEVRPLTPGDLRILLFSVLSATQRSQYELEREIDFALATDDGARFRINAYYQKGRMAASLRAIPRQIPSVDDLLIPPSVVALADRPHGLLLVVGPTGSGKSTTLACLVDRINRGRACRIMTVEDPIEYTHEGQRATIDQREVGADTTSFAAALKYVLRQDPDVILVGEMRDLETISAAITAAETGHLVLATLHTNDAVGAIDRIVDVFPEHAQAQVRPQLAAALLGVVSQRLLPRVGGGRIGAFEVLVATPAIRTMVRDNKMHQAQSSMETGMADGMVTMDRALRELVVRNLVDYDEAMRYVRNPRALGERRHPTGTAPPVGHSG